MTYHPLVSLGDGFSGREAPGPGPGLLWLHPYALDASCFAELWELLPGLDHVGLDLPGHGRSLPLPAGQQLPELAERVLRVAAARGARHLVALSWSTLLALEMAAAQPHAFDSLVLASPLPRDGAAGEPFWPRYRELVNMYRMGGYGEHLRGRLMLVEPSPFDGARTRPALWQTLWDAVGRHPFFDLQDTWPVRLAQAPGEVRLHAITPPTLLFMGGRDSQAARRFAARLARVLPECRRLDDLAAARLSLLEAPATAARAIEGHVRAHAAPRAAAAARGQEER